MIENGASTAVFVRGFFLFLESRRIRAAILHGGAGGFEHVLSDVDFVVDHSSFPQLPAIVNEYCSQTGWQLCQILRHETTAAYFVCSAIDDPSRAVALDACSDYQRNGTVFLPAEDILGNLQPLAWGGHCLSTANELRYRFAKAAAKDKDATFAQKEFARYPEEIRRDCAAWLHQNWGISSFDWDNAGLARALPQLRAKSNHRPSLLQRGTIGRILFRVLQPSGLVVIAGDHGFDEAAAILGSIFGHLYFRRFKKSRQWRPALLNDLVASTMIVIPDLGPFWSRLLPADCVHRFNSTPDSVRACRELAKHLHQRCFKRESLFHLAPQE